MHTKLNMENPACFILSALLSAVALSALVPELSAQDGSSDKLAYSVIYFDFGGDFFKPQSSSATTPTRNCQDAITNLGCAEQFTSVGAFSLAMGVRPIRYLQIDAFQMEAPGNFNGFGNRTSTFQCVSGCGSSTVTTQAIGSLTGLATTGARAVLPLFHERLLVSAGAGFGWLWTNERAEVGANTQAVCRSCRGVGGHGPTEIAEIMYLPNQHVGIGLHVRNLQISSSGLTPITDTSSYFFGTKYRDRFLLIGGEVSIRWVTRH